MKLKFANEPHTTFLKTEASSLSKEMSSNSSNNMGGGNTIIAFLL